MGRQTEAELDRTGFIATTGGALNATLGSLLERYAREISPGKKGGDIEAIRLKQIGASRLGSVPMAKLGPNHIREYMAKRLELVSGDTVRRELVIVQHAIETSRKSWGLPIYGNPVRQIRKPSASEPRKRRLSPTEQAILLVEAYRCRNDLMAPIIRFALALRGGKD